MAPCMDNWLRLDDPVQIELYATTLRRLTDPAYFESCMFMPVVRDISAGQRKLLYNFLDAEPAEHLLKRETPAAQTFAQRSRSMRRM
jgi:hypothetical protein